MGPVLFIDELAALLKTSTRTLRKLLAANRCPIPPLPAIDKRHRWSRAAVDRYLEGQNTTVRWKRVG